MQKPPPLVVAVQLSPVAQNSAEGGLHACAQIEPAPADGVTQIPPRSHCWPPVHGLPMLVAPPSQHTAPDDVRSTHAAPSSQTEDPRVHCRMQREAPAASFTHASPVRHGSLVLQPAPSPGEAVPHPSAKADANIKTEAVHECLIGSSERARANQGGSSAKYAGVRASRPERFLNRAGTAT